MNEKAIECVIEYLENKGQKTSIEDDIVKTWKDLNRKPFDYEKAKSRVIENDAKYPDIKAEIGVMPATTIKTTNELTEADLRYNLTNQLNLLLLKAGLQINKT